MTVTVHNETFSPCPRLPPCSSNTLLHVWFYNSMFYSMEHYIIAIWRKRLKDKCLKED